MQILTYGVKKPETGDKGSIFFPALEYDLQQLNDHNHNGVNSSTLASAAIALTTQSLLAANWVLYAQGTWRQAVAMPSGLLYADRYILFKEATSGDQIWLSTEKITTTSYYVYIGDNTLSLVATYL